MTLWNMYKTWERDSKQNLKVIDGTKVYEMTNIPSELWDREVKAFYFEADTLIIRL